MPCGWTAWQADRSAEMSVGIEGRLFSGGSESGSACVPSLCEPCGRFACRDGATHGALWDSERVLRIPNRSFPDDSHPRRTIPRHRFARFPIPCWKTSLARQYLGRPEAKCPRQDSSERDLASWSEDRGLRFRSLNFSFQTSLFKSKSYASLAHTLVMQ